MISTPLSSPSPWTSIWAEATIDATFPTRRPSSSADVSACGAGGPSWSAETRSGGHAGQSLRYKRPIAAASFICSRRLVKVLPSYTLIGELANR